KDDHLEQALWTAVRAMEEATSLRMRMATMAEKGGWTKMAPPYREQAEQLRQRADLIRELLTDTPVENGGGKGKGHGGPKIREVKRPKASGLRRGSKGKSPKTGRDSER